MTRAFRPVSCATSIHTASASKTFGRDEAYLAAQTKAFVDSGYRFPELMAQIASSPEFFKVVVPKRHRAPDAEATSRTAAEACKE